MRMVLSPLKAKGVNQEMPQTIRGMKTRLDCIVKGKCSAIKHKLESLQADMETFYLSIKRVKILQNIMITIYVY